MKPKDRINNLQKLLKRYLDTYGHSPNDSLDKFEAWANRDDDFIAAISVHGLLMEDQILLGRSWDEVYETFEHKFLDWYNNDPSILQDWLLMLPDGNAWGTITKDCLGDGKEMFDMMLFYLDQCQEFKVFTDTNQLLVHVFIDECPTFQQSGDSSK